MAGIGVLGTMTPRSVERSQGFMRNAIAAEAARSDKYEHEEPKKGLGGAIMGAAGLGLAGAEAAKLMGISGLTTPMGFGIGAVAGIAAYIFS